VKKDFRDLMEYLVENATMYGEYWWKYTVKSEKWSDTGKWRGIPEDEESKCIENQVCGVVIKCVLNYNLVECS
jgi:hypothetical protein